MKEDKLKVLFADAVATSQSSILVGDLAKILKQNRLYLSDRCNYDILKNLFNYSCFKYNIAGFITIDDLKTIINSNHYIPQGSTLNQSTHMDADNYYIQSDDMGEIEELINLL